MKNKIIIALILIATSAYSQKIGTIDYGNNYRAIKNLSYSDFKDKCNDGRGWIIEGSVFPHMIEDHNGYSYMCSKFANLLKTKDSGIVSEYVDELETYAGICKDEMFRKGYSNEFKQGTNKAYQYLQLQIERFEIISEYYKDIYNYQIDKQSEEKRITQIEENVRDSIIALKKNDESYSRINNELNSLKQQKENSRAKYSTEIENKIKQIDSIKNKKIKSLHVQNYSFNKSKIVNEYDPKITQLKKELNSKLNDNETFWNDRIKVKEEELERFLVNNDALYEDKIIAEQEYKRNEFRNKNNLSTIRDRLDEKYKKDLSVINDKSEKKKI